MADMNISGDKSMLKITVVTVAVIFIMLLFVYRSIVTVIILLVMVGIEVQVARGVVAFLGDHQILSDFRHLPSVCWYHSRSRPERTTGYSSSGAITRRVRPARTGRRPSTPHTAGLPKWSWVPV